MTLVETLKKSLLFSGLSERDLISLGGIVVRRLFKKGERLFNEGDPANGFFLLVSGQVKLCKVSKDGREKVLHFVHPGETFAEAAMFASATYPAECRATEAGEVLFLSKQGFMDLLSGNAGFTLNLVVSLSLSLRRFARQIEELSFSDVPARLASYLLQRVAEHSTTYAGITYLELGLKKGELAAQLGTVNETLSRCFKKLKDEHIIELDGRKVTILQMEKLHQLANRQKVG